MVLDCAARMHSAHTRARVLALVSYTSKVDRTVWVDRTLWLALNIRVALEARETCTGRGALSVSAFCVDTTR